MEVLNKVIQEVLQSSCSVNWGFVVKEWCCKWYGRREWTRIVGRNVGLHRARDRSQEGSEEQLRCAPLGELRWMWESIKWRHWTWRLR